MAYPIGKDTIRFALQSKCDWECEDGAPSGEGPGQIIAVESDGSDDAGGPRLMNLEAQTTIGDCQFSWYRDPLAEAELQEQFGGDWIALVEPEGLSIYADRVEALEAEIGRPVR